MEDTRREIRLQKKYRGQAGDDEVRELKDCRGKIKIWAEGGEEAYLKRSGDEGFTGMRNAVGHK